MTKRVSDLTKEELGYWAARARGINNVEFEDDSVFIVYGRDDTSTVFGERLTTAPGRRITAEEYRPDTNGGQAMELVVEYGISIRVEQDIEGVIDDYYYCSIPRIYGSFQAEGFDLFQAICRAVIASHYGDEVSVSDRPEGVPDDE